MAVPCVRRGRRRRRRGAAGATPSRPAASGRSCADGACSGRSTGTGEGVGTQLPPLRPAAGVLLAARPRRSAGAPGAAAEGASGSRNELAWRPSAEANRSPPNTCRQAFAPGLCCSRPPATERGWPKPGGLARQTAAASQLAAAASPRLQPHQPARLPGGRGSRRCGRQLRARRLPPQRCPSVSPPMGKGMCAQPAGSCV